MGKKPNQPAAADAPEDFSKVSVEDTIKKVGADAKSGLSSAEAKSRLDKYGPNALEEHKESELKKLLAYFWGPIPWMIEVAAILSLIIKHWTDFIIIAVLLLLNAAIGFLEEHKAANALEALKNQLALHARALRDGKWDEVEAATLVPGDTIRIRLGDIVPADVKLIDGEYLSIDQSALTGESLPVSKKIGDVAFSGSIAKQGEMVAIVTTTGGETFFGRTAKLVETAGAVSHFQKAVIKVGDFLIICAGILSVILIVGELMRHTHVLVLVQFVLILVVASIPVAMPAVLSVTMALGAVALSKKKAIVSKLQSIEEMAGVDILCSDKTGTLTQNKITLGDAQPAGEEKADDLILMGALASKAENKDPIDLAVIAGVKDASILEKYTQTAFVPFDPIKKRTEATLQESGGATFKSTKGAPQVILDLAKVDGDARAAVQKIVDADAVKGMRTLGVAKSDGGDGWKFLGILPLFDPPREDSAATIAAAQQYGIQVKMVTGDNAAIGREIAGQLGIGTNIQPATELFTAGVNADNMPPESAVAIEKADGFAEVFPEHKYGIVKALQKRGHIVAMTGDGVNDAPALKQADVGIAVSGATDAARAAAALVLTAPGLSVIIQAVEEARKIFERMMSYTIYRISMTIDIMVFVVLASLIFGFFPLTAVMIIVLALLDDIPIMTIAYDNTYLDPKPVRWNMRRVLSISSILGFLSVVQSFGLLVIAKDAWATIGPAFHDKATIDTPHIQTMLFLQLVAGGHLLLLVTRSQKAFWMKPFPSWQLFSAVVLTQIFAVLMCAFGWLVPSVSWGLIGFVWLYNIIWIFIQDFVKLGIYRLISDRAKHKKGLVTVANQSLHKTPTSPPTTTHAA